MLGRVDKASLENFYFTSSGAETPKQSCQIEESFASAASTLVAASTPAVKNTSISNATSDSELEANDGNQHNGSSLRLVGSRVKNFLSGSFGRGEGRRKRRRKKSDIQVCIAFMTHPS